MLRFFAIVLVLLIAAASGFVIYQVKVLNPAVAKELREQPNGPRAQRVMLMTIDDRKTLPVNYLREDDVVYIGADGPWWRELQGQGQPVAMLIKGEIFGGQARAVMGRPEFTKDVFKRLRPDVPKWLPSWLSGVLVEITLTQMPAAAESAVLTPLPSPADVDAEPVADATIFEESADEVTNP